MNYQEITSAIANNKPFTHNGTMSATIHNHLFRLPGTHLEGAPDGMYYMISSYSTVIYWENLKTGEKWLNPKKYSVTTSRQQNIIRKVKGI